MNENDVKNYLEDLITEGQYEGDINTQREDEDMLKAAVALIEELQQYRMTGTAEEFRELAGKKELKKPELVGDGVDRDGNIIYDMYRCPGCGRWYELEYEEYRYCPECGQAIGLGDAI